MAIPILQTDASDYGIGGYLFMVISGKVRVVCFFSRALIGPQKEMIRHSLELPTHCPGYVRTTCSETRKEKTVTLSALQTKQHLKIAAVHNSSVGRWGQAK